MKISFGMTENGGSCLTACHSEKKYDRTISAKDIPDVQHEAKK